MPLPSLPPNYQKEAYQQLTSFLPQRWFHQLVKGKGLYALLWGMARAIAYLRYSYDQALQAAIPMLSAGIWLTLHLRSIGLDRTAQQSDQVARDRYRWEFKPARNSRQGELDALRFFFNIEPPLLQLQGDRSTGRFGEFRVVIASRNQRWTELQFEFIGDFVRRYVTNGVIPSVDIGLEFQDQESLRIQRLPVWRFCDQFPTSFNSIGGVWERPIFANPANLSFARSLIVRLDSVAWRSRQQQLTKLFFDARQDAPGGLFVYLAEPASIYLNADYDLNLLDADPDLAFPNRPFVVDGWHFYHNFPYFGSLAGSFIAPFFEVPDGPFVSDPPFPPLAVLELRELYPNFPGDQTQVGSDRLIYEGRDFTRGKITQFLDAAPFDDTGDNTSAELALMRSGPWTLGLTGGDSRWGNFPPVGNTLVGSDLVELQPTSIWWTDATGVKSPTALYDGAYIYLAIEFILPARQLTPQAIRELELRLDGDRVDYRRLSYQVNNDLNTGFIYKVRAH